MGNGKSNVNGAEQQFIGSRIEEPARFGLRSEPPRERAIEDIGERGKTEHPSRNGVFSAGKPEEDEWGGGDPRQGE